MTSRREALRKLFQGGLAMTASGLAWGSLAANSGHSNVTLRPPGALPGKEFSKACIKCGQCLEACPYDTLRFAEPGDSKVNGTPYFVSREVPCYMCPSIPCAEVCP